MAASPHVLVRNGSGSYVNPDAPGDPIYPGGVNVTPGNTISLKLASADSVGQWNLKVVGTDEETVRPFLVDVDPATGIVSTPSTVVTFVVPAGVAGRTYIFQSVVNNGGPAYTATFGIYTLTANSFRVGAVGERFENDPLFGWTRTLNQFIKRGGGGGGIPPVSHVRYATLVEDPLGILAWERMTDEMLVGGYRAMVDHAARNAIPPESRKRGMWVQTLNDGYTWNLESDLITWTQIGGAPTGAAGGDLGGNYPNPEVVGILNTQIVTPGTSIDLNLNFPAGLKTGEVLGALPGSGDPQKVLTLTTFDFIAIRKSSVVLVNVDHTDPTIYTSTPLPLNNTAGTLDLNHVTIFNGIYDGTRYAWFVGDYNGSSFYLWRVDTTLAGPVVAYQLSLTLPAVLSSLSSITYAAGFILIGAHDSHDNSNKILKTNPATGAIVSTTAFPQLEINPTPSVDLTIPIGDYPRGCASDGTHVYVANVSGNSISRILIATGAVDLTITDTSISSPVNCLWDGGQYLYVSNPSSPITRIAVATGLFHDTITVPGSGAMVRDNSGNIYSVDSYNHTVAKIRISDGVVLTTIDLNSISGVGYQPGIGFDNGNYIYVCDLYLGVHRIDTTTDTYVDTISGFSSAFGIRWDHADHMYVAEESAFTIARIRISDAFVDHLYVGVYAPIDFAWDGDHTMWVAPNGSSSAVPVDTLTFTAGTEVVVGDSPYGITWDGYTHIYVANSSDNTLSRINISTTPYFASLVPDLNAATSNGDYSWFSGFVDSTSLKLDRFNPSTLVHKVNDTWNLEGHPIATDLPTAQVILNSLKANYTAHLSQAGVHLVTDIDPNSTVSSIPNATDSMTPVVYTYCANLVNDLKAKINAHLTQAGIHAYEDTVSTITTANATASNLASILTLANDIGYAVGTTLHGKFNDHLSQSVSGNKVHQVDDWVNTETMPIATDITSLKDHLLDVAYFYTQHIESTLHHTVADTVNVLTASQDLENDLGQYETATNLAIGLKQALNYHMLKAGVHYHYDQNQVTTPNPNNSNYTDLAGIIALTNALGYAGTNGAFNAHLSRTRSLVHGMIGYEEFTAFADLFGITDASSLLGNTATVLNNFQPFFNAHLVYSGAHPNNDTVNTSTTAQANDTVVDWWPTTSNLANDLKQQLNNHLSNSGGVYHTTSDTANLITTPDSMPWDFNSIVDLTNALGYSMGYGAFNAHRTARGIPGIPTGSGPGSLAWDGGDYMYITNSNDDTVTIVHRTTHAVATTVIVDPGPSAVAWDGGAYMYVACQGTWPSMGSVVRIEVSSQTVIDHIPVEMFPLAICKCGTNMYVVNTSSASVSIIEIATGSVTNTIAMGTGTWPTAIVGDAAGNNIYVTDSDFDIVSRVNTNTLNQTTRNLGGSGPSSICIDGNGILYVVNSMSGTVTLIDTDSFSVGPEVTVGSGPTSAAWDGGTPGYVYVTNYDDDSVSRISAATGLVVSTVTLASSSRPMGIAWDGGTDIWTTEAWISQVARILISTGALIIPPSLPIHSLSDQVNYEALPYDVYGVISAATLAAVQAHLVDLATQYTNHISNTGGVFHSVVDVTNVLTAPSPTDVAPTFPTTYALAMDLKEKFNLHLTQAGVHYNPDTTSTVLDVVPEWNLKPFPAPDPADESDLTAIVNITRALATRGYYGSPLNPSGGANGAYDFHLTQPAEFLETTLPQPSGVKSVIAIKGFASAGDYRSLIVMGQFSGSSDGVPIFWNILAQNLDGDGANAVAPGAVTLYWSNNPPSSYPISFTLVDDADLWFITSGYLDAAPYLNRIIDFSTAPDMDLNIPVLAGMGPTDIAGGGALGPIRVAYGLGDYVGDVDNSTGSLDQLAKYPMGGALGFFSLEVELGAQANGTALGNFSNINFTGFGVYNTPTLTGGTLTLNLPPSGVWSSGGTYPDNMLPTVIEPGKGIKFTGTSGSPLVISAGLPPVVAVALTNIPNYSAVTQANFDGVDLVAGDRVLLCRQTSGYSNGIYHFAGWGNYLYLQDDPIYGGSELFVEKGEIFAGVTFKQTQPGSLILGYDQVWYPVVGPDLAPPLTTYNGAGGGVTWYPIDTVPGPPTDGYDLILVTDNVATNTATGAGIQRERGAVTYHLNAGTLTLSDDSRSLTSDTFFRQVIDGNTVEIQVGRQASGSNYKFRVRVWFEYVRSV